LALSLIIVLIALLCLWKTSITRVDNYFHRENRVSWTMPEIGGLKPGPAVFRYDGEQKELAYLGSIDSKTKSELIELLPLEMRDKSTGTQASYWAAIDKLALDSNRGLTGLLISLLCLGGLSGAIGSHLRSITAFVGNACFKQQLDVEVWWPYYAMRPFTGFILGIVVVVVVQAGIIELASGSPSGTLWWVAVAILSGYGDDEFTQKLRLLSKTLFGDGRSA
jgi:hypothetical protein